MVGAEKREVSMLGLLSWSIRMTLGVFGTTPPHLPFCLLMVSGCFQELLELLLHKVFAGACPKRRPDAFIQEVLEEQEERYHRVKPCQALAGSLSLVTHRLLLAAP